MLWCDKITLKNSNALLSLGYNAIILSAENKTGKIVLDAGSSLTVNNSSDPNKATKPIALIGGVDVKANATFTVSEGSYLHLGPFYVDAGESLLASNGSMNIEKGTDIT
ncbi:MAG: hypothetical protein K8F24_08485, partial [Bacteroidales bacterium]|nr:hypothetical protein [Bacteroidales bacterium]